MKRIFMMLIGLLFISSAAMAYADGGLKSGDSDTIKAAGISIYPGANYVNGNQETGFRFATADPLNKVRQWYADKLPAWSVYESYGNQILYDGKPGLEMRGVMSKNQISINENKNLPAWFSLDANMTTEIVVMIP